MKALTKYIFFVILLVCNTYTLSSQVIWAGSDVTFTKANMADWTLMSNQDHLTPNVALTRANNKGLFNIIVENSYSNFSSPQDTEWAYGTTDDLDGLTFQDWQTTHGNVSPMLNEPLVMHLITDDIYIDIQFTSWAGGMNGGFSYTRSSNSVILPYPAIVPTLGQWAIIILLELMLIVGVVSLVQSRKTAIQ